MRGFIGYAPAPHPMPNSHNPRSLNPSKAKVRVIPPYTLASVRADKISIACEMCNRRGTYSVAGLAKKYGMDIMLPDLKDRIVEEAGCFRAGSITEPCGARYTPESIASWI